MKRKTLTVPEAGKVLGLGRNSSYDAARRGEIPTVRIGKRLLVPRAALAKLLGQTDDDFDLDLAATSPAGSGRSGHGLPTVRQD